MDSDINKVFRNATRAQKLALQLTKSNYEAKLAQSDYEAKLAQSHYEAKLAQSESHYEAKLAQSNYEAKLAQSNYEAKLAQSKNELSLANVERLSVIQPLSWRRMIEEFEKKNSFLLVKNKNKQMKLSRSELWRIALENDLAREESLREFQHLVKNMKDVDRVTNVVTDLYRTMSEKIHFFDVPKKLIVDKSSLFENQVR
jgi:3-dehydroquinate dehydratase